LKNSGTATSTR